MKTEQYPHKIAAVYPDGTAAQEALQALDDARLDNIEVTSLNQGKAGVSHAIEPETEETANRIVLDAVYGTAAGGAAGAVTAGAIAAVLPSLFVSAPVVAPLIVLGYGATIGGTAGAVLGLKPRENMLAGLVKDSLKSGFHVVIVHAANPEARQRAEAVIARTMAEKTARS